MVQKRIWQVINGYGIIVNVEVEDSKKIESSKTKVSLAAILIGLLIVIVVLISLIFLVASNRQQSLSNEGKFGEIGSEQLNDTISSYMYGEGNSQDYDELLDYLNNLITNSDVQAERVDARYYKAILLYYNGMQDEAISLLRDGLQKEQNITNQERFFILNTLLNFYTEMSNRDGQIEVLRNIVALPDDMVLENQDWQRAKKDIYSTITGVRG